MESWEKMHHAYLVRGASSDMWFLLENKLDFKKQANPDALSLELENFGIDEARDLSSWANKKAFGKRKVAVISATSITLEAQNALLKLFEEPAENTYFFLSIQNLGSIIPTLFSRIQLITLDQVEDHKTKTNFLEADISNRFKIINPIIKNKDKDEAKKLISELARSIKGKSSIETVLKAERIISGRSSSIKMVLEQLALTL